MQTLKTILDSLAVLDDRIIGSKVLLRIYKNFSFSLKRKVCKSRTLELGYNYRPIAVIFCAKIGLAESRSVQVAPNSSIRRKLSKVG